MKFNPEIEAATSSANVALLRLVLLPLVVVISVVAIASTAGS